jgi:tRNA-splicing ligase RtcB (3'-phosphate/5'-hydroxy nucleic acid ligase)
VSGAVVRSWLAGPLPREVVAPLERLAATQGVARIAVMPDVHFAEGVCVGVVAATWSRLYPEAVGTDLGCGMAAVRFRGSAALDERSARRVFAGLARAVPANRHGGPSLRERLPEPLADLPLSHASLDAEARRDGRVQFATLGRGNHFLELQCDEEECLWLTVHSGSRAMGRAIVLRHLLHAPRTDTGLAFLEADSLAGTAYLGDLAWALAYADASRRAALEAGGRVLSDVLRVEPEPETFFGCLHNHVRRETHAGETLWVHRKGAVSAAAGEPGIVPGSMGDPSFHVEGRGCAEALASSSHGAGRAMGRADARRRISPKDLRRRMGAVHYDRRIERDLVEEAPQAYKDVRRVMRAQRELTRVVRRLRPLLCYKGA